MHILEYCNHTGERVAALAKRMGLDRSHLNKIARGQRDASADLLRRLYAASDGLITPTDQVFAPRVKPSKAETAPRPKSGHSKRGSRRPAAQKPKPRLKPRAQLGAAG